MKLITPVTTIETMDHVFMVQSRDQKRESRGTALAELYHNFVQIRALESKILRERKFIKIKTFDRTTDNGEDTISI